MKLKRKLPLVFIISILLIPLGISFVGAAEPIPIPKVEGAIPVTATSFPFLAADRLKAPLNLSAVGYKEEEYFLSGKANVYDWKEDGSTPVLNTGDYTNRILVRKPVNPQKFSGTVIVDLFNATNGYDVGYSWAYADLFTSRGHAWVGITLKPLTVLALKKFNPSRYVALSWKSPRPMPEGCKLTPDYAPDTEEGLVWDIINQVGALLKSKDPKNPLAGYKVEHLFMTSMSQSSDTIVTFLNAGFYDRAVMADGKHIWSGFLTDSGGGRGKPIHQCTRPPAMGTPRMAFKGRAPTIVIQTGSDFNAFDALKTRKADSDTPGDQFRLYEIAGTTHVSTYGKLVSSPNDADQTAAGYPPHTINFMKEPIINDLPREPIVKGAWVNLEKWARDGTPPPKGERIQVENPTMQDPTVFPPRFGFAVLDENGNQKGGVRTPYVDVPIATYYSWYTSAVPIPIPSGTSTAATIDRNWLYGFKTPFDQEKLKKLYGTQENYVKKVWENVDKLVGQRWITPEDGWKIKDQAARSNLITK